MIGLSSSSWILAENEERCGAGAVAGAAAGAAAGAYALKLPRIDDPPSERELDGRSSSGGDCRLAEGDSNGA